MRLLGSFAHFLKQPGGHYIMLIIFLQAKVFNHYTNRFLLFNFEMLCVCMLAQNNKKENASRLLKKNNEAEMHTHPQRMLLLLSADTK